MIDLLPNQTVAIQWLLFMVAVFTLHFGIFRPVLRILEERKSRTEGLKQNAAVLEKKSEELAAQLEKKLEEGRSRGLRKKEEHRSFALRVSEDLLKKTKAELDQSIERARKEIEVSSQAARSALQKEVEILGREITSKILGKAV